MLGFLLQHHPQADAVGRFALAAGRQKLADERVRIELAAHQAPPGHYRVGVVDAAVFMRLGVLQQRGEVRIQRTANLLCRRELDAHLLCQRQPLVRVGEVLQRAHSSRFREDGAVQPALFFGDEIFARCLAESRVRFCLEGNAREEAAQMQIFFHTDAAVPPCAFERFAAVEVRLVHVLQRGRLVDYAEVAEAFENEGSDLQRGLHAGEPREATVIALAGE